MYMIQHTESILLDRIDHFIKHIKGIHLVLNNRISLSISCQSNTLTKDFHIINMIHPFAVNALQQNYTLQLTKLLGLDAPVKLDAGGDGLETLLGALQGEKIY